MFHAPASTARHALRLTLLFSLAACSGSIGEHRNAGESHNNRGGGNASAGSSGGDSGGRGGGSGVDVERPSFACDASKVPNELPLRRLTARQLRNTLDDLLRFALPRSGSAVLATVERQLALVPNELRPKVAGDAHGSFRRLAQEVSQQYVDAWLDVAVAVATEVTTGARLGELVGTCATDTDRSNDTACLRTFITKLGSRAHRRPIAAADLDAYVTLAGSGGLTAKGVANAVATILISPRVLYFVEHGGNKVDGPGERYALDGYELASRLSYQAWDAPPDDALLDAAKGGMLTTDAGLSAAVNRVLADPRARRTMETFFEEWWHLDELPDASALGKEAAYRAFAGKDLPDATFRTAAVRDILELVSHVRGGGEGGGLADLFHSKAVFPTTDALAKIYGVPRWTSGAPALAPDRPGILTRAGLLYRANPAGRTNPIMKGVFVRQSILCDEVPPPPPNALAQAAKTDTGDAVTERQIASALTEMKGTTCASCHETLINPLGFVTEGFDALGRSREIEQRFDPSTGEITASAPVDTRVVPRVFESDEREVAGPAELADLLVESGKPAACLARQYFRYTFARLENDEQDGCALEKVRVAADGKLDDALRGLMLAGAFREKSFAIQGVSR